MRFTIFALITLFAATKSFAQKTIVKPEMPIGEESLVNYTSVRDMSGTTKSELYKRAYNFFTTYYPSKAVIQNSDSVAGHIEGKAKFDTQKEVKGIKSLNERVQYTLIIDVKEGRYRYQITRINLAAQSYKPIEPYLAESDKDVLHISALEQAHEQFEKIEQDLRDAMNKPSVKVKKDDW